jgi:predicted transcriptional regulator
MSDRDKLAKGSSALEDEIEGNAKRVLRYVVEHPGCYLRQIHKALVVSMGTTQYHLRLLEKEGRIISRKRGFHRYYFPPGIFQENEKNLLEVLSNETAREVLILVIEARNPTQSQIADKIGMSAPSVSWQLHRLTESQVITEVREGKYKRYQLRGDPRALISLMKNYYPSLWDTWSDRLAEMFVSLSQGEEGGP